MHSVFPLKLGVTPADGGAAAAAPSSCSPAQQGTWGWGAPSAARITSGRSVQARELHKGARADTGAATTAQRAAEWTTAAEQVRRARHSDSGHEDANRLHQRFPHLAMELWVASWRPEGGGAGGQQRRPARVSEAAAAAQS
jgi:hypothetical protein